MRNQPSNIAKLVFLCAAFGAFSTATPGQEATTPVSGLIKPFLPPVPQGQKWQLAWSDEFDGARIDRSK